VKGNPDGDYQWAGVFVVWNCTVVHAVSKYKLFWDEGRNLSNGTAGMKKMRVTKL
jgi:hypothetical protein